MLQVLVAVFCLLDDKGVSHIPKPQHLWMGGYGLDFNLFHEQVCHNMAIGGCKGCPMHLFITLILEEVIHVFKEEFQTVYDMLY